MKGCVCLCQSPCVCVCMCSLGAVSRVGRAATSKAAGHVTAGDRDLAGLYKMSGERGVVPMCLCVCVLFHNVYAYWVRSCVVMSVLRHVQISFRLVQSFPIAALDQRAWVKPWTLSNRVWKNLAGIITTKFKYQEHACPFLLCSVPLAHSSGQTWWTNATFFLMWSLWERRSRSNKAWLGTLTPFLLRAG